MGRGFRLIKENDADKVLKEAEKLNRESAERWERRKEKYEYRRHVEEDKKKK